MTTETNNIKVLMVDDHEIMRQAYGMLLNTDPDIEIVGFAGDGQEALTLVDTLGPNVVIMDGEMPRVNGVDAARIIREKHPDMAIVLLSAFDDDEFVREFLKGNVRGKAYLLKQSLQSLSDLVQAVKDVAEGKTYLASEIVAKLAGTQNNPESAFLSELTERGVKCSAAWLEDSRTQRLLRSSSFSPELLSDTLDQSSRRCDSNLSQKPMHVSLPYLLTSRTQGV